MEIDPMARATRERRDADPGSLKVALLHDSLGRSHGGIEAWLYHAADTLVALGHSVLAATPASGELPRDAMPPGIAVTSLSTAAPLGVPGLRDWSWCRRLAVELRELLTGVDLVWSRSYMLTLAARRALGSVPVVFIHADSFPLYLELFGLNRDTPESLRRRLHHVYRVRKVARYERQAMRMATVLVYLSRTKMEEALDYHGEGFRPKCHIVPPGVDLERFAPATGDDVGDGPLRIVSVGRLSPEKNQACLIEAVARLKERGVAVACVLVGEGTDRGGLEELVSRRDLAHEVCFAGRREDVESFYRAAQVFVLPSTMEGFGIAYAEALASGLPCVALRNVPGRLRVATHEIIEHEKTGLLVEDDSPELLADALQRLQRSPEQRAEWSRNARRAAESRFNWKRTVERILAISGVPVPRQNSIRPTQAASSHSYR